MKRLSILLLTGFLAAAFVLPGCNFLKKADETQEDQNMLLLLLGAAWLASQSSCKNQSGLVICIPPGVPL